RFYLRYEPGFDLTSGRAGAALHGGEKATLGGDVRPKGDDYFEFIGFYDSARGGPVILGYYPGMYMQCPATGTCHSDEFPCTFGATACTNPDHLPKVPARTLETGRWYCMELAVDSGMPTTSGAGADGVIDWSIDGKGIGPFSGLWMRSSPALFIK